MTIGKITSTQQDLVYVEARVEDDTFTETNNGGFDTEFTYIGICKQEFSVDRWFGRIKSVILNAQNTDIVLRLYDSNGEMIQDKFVKNVGKDQVIHFIFDPLPPGEYTFEIDTLGNKVTVGSFGFSSYGGFSINNFIEYNHSLKLKIMHYTTELQQKAVAVVGDEVDNGSTSVSNGIEFGKIMTGNVEYNINRAGDMLENGGHVLTGCWYAQI